MPALAEGTKAPAFKSVDQDGKPISLADFKGKKLIIYFYPEDDTPTCTQQACNLRDNIGLLKKKGFAIVGISPNGAQSHKKFEQKYSLPFPLVADEGRKIIEKYGVWGEKQMFGNKYMGVLRTTFLVDEKGIIRKIIRRVIAKKHTEEILKAWETA